MRENAEGTKQARRGWLLPESDPGCRAEGWLGILGERFGQAAGEFLRQSHYQRMPVSPRSGSTWVPRHAQILAKSVCGKHGLGVTVKCYYGAMVPWGRAVMRQGGRGAVVQWILERPILEAATAHQHGVLIS